MLLQSFPGNAEHIGLPNLSITTSNNNKKKKSVKNFFFVQQKWLQNYCYVCIVSVFMTFSEKNVLAARLTRKKVH